jgi:hypothetical protein
MNTLNIHTRLGTIVHAALTADVALSHANRTQLDVSLAIILASLQAIHAELKSPDAEANSARVREQITNGPEQGA